MRASEGCTGLPHARVDYIFHKPGASIPHAGPAKTRCARSMVICDNGMQDYEYSPMLLLFLLLLKMW